MTDLTKWKLHVNRGRQVWKYNPDQKPEDQKFYDRYHVGLNTVSISYHCNLINIKLAHVIFRMVMYQKSQNHKI